MSKIYTPDLCIIGAGAGGLSVAAGAARLGAAVVLIEKAAMGGDCLNYGCIPSKALIACAKAAYACSNAHAYGVIASCPQTDWTAVRSRIKSVIAAIEPNDSERRFAAMGVKIVRASARFVDSTTVQAGGDNFRARRFVIATGSTPHIPAIPGLELVRYLTNETIFDLPTLPKRLVILGGGPIGMELAQAFRRLGSEIVVLEAGQCLSGEDPEISQVALAQIAFEGVEIRENVRIKRIEPDGAGIRVLLDAQSPNGSLYEDFVLGDHLLVATGRRPDLGALGLEAADVRYDSSGVVTNASLRSSNKRVYAIGDCAGGAAAGAGFTHAAGYHASLVLGALLFRAPIRLKPTIIPRAIYTDPEIASIGLSEAQAQKNGFSIKIWRASFGDNDRANTEGVARGHLKAITARNGKILGCSLVGAGASELLAPWSLAMAEGLKIQSFAKSVFPYPTRAEISRRAALNYYGEMANKKSVRGLVRFLRRFN